MLLGVVLQENVARGGNNYSLSWAAVVFFPSPLDVSLARSLSLF